MPSVALSNASTFIAWTVSVIIGITLIVAASVWAGFRGSETRLTLREGFLFFALSFVVTTVMIIAEEISRIPSAPEDAEAVVNIETLRSLWRGSSAR